MREYDDDSNIQHYAPVLRRIIILVAVITAVPVMLWTITAFMQTYIAQPTIMLSRAPCVIDDNIESRHVDLRPFVLCGEKVVTIPGALTRVAAARERGRVTAGKSDGVYGACAGAADAFEPNAFIGQDRVQDTPGEGAVRASTL